VPAIAYGYGPITITGTAAPNATVRLREAAYIYRDDMDYATYWDMRNEFNEDMPPTVQADSRGAYRIRRVVDSGFVFSVETADGESRIAEVPMQAIPEVESVTSTTAGSVTFRVMGNPGEPGLKVEIQRRSGSTWTTVGAGEIGEDKWWTGTITGQPSGPQTYRVYLGGSPSNLVRPGYSKNDYTIDAGSGGDVTLTPGDHPLPDGTDTTPDTSAPSPGTPAPTPTPTKPSPPPVKPSPTVPAAAQPTAGSVQFTRINYDAPGKDRRTRKSMNGEWFRLTNKTSCTINLKGWTVRDAGGHVYRFAADAYLGAGRSVHIHSGSGTNGSPTLHRYWHARSHVWNNGGDTATLRSNTNKTIDTCRWTKDHNATSC